MNTTNIPRIALMLIPLLSIVNNNTKGQSRSRGGLDSAINHTAAMFMSDPARVTLSIGIYDHGNLFTYHFGKKEVPDDESVYEIGSITKTMTGILLANAVREKKVMLDDDIRKYMDGQYPNLEYEGQPIRLSQLLNHTSGLPFSLPASPVPGQTYTKEQFYQDLHLVKLDTVPGYKLSYSNSAAQLLGYILERVYRKTYDQLLAEYITTPLRMSNTGINISRHLLKGHNNEGEIMPYTESGAAGGVRSTLPDMLQYIRYEMDESNPVVALSHQPTWGEIQNYAIGLNWQMLQKAGKQKSIFQNGGTSGFSSNLVFYPDLKTGIVLLTNEADKTAQDKLSEVAEQIFAQLNK
ncbi:CubicO group peptidase, beta-lactamase class C family [Chitinophaga sp. CF118]|uniref:serine hydrolase domain-containing protein n=1 Tax=Chitinophaga sp. CF118 TaxID=1884367 RepID=UPI0008ED44B8|nr:serine hydrolase domain-containing protein [Chitinophaga sp. CF118]SFD08988.1 CubicO group peptidase, beta-lactamase class C family [Chitinophaga sp. CF118]